ncbi:MAG: hypothetical protein A2787_01860 [Omnitrophica WOR_2 bacterium RIFCSPHIGHO2_01_FULL_48_9]|nr:MAG: hypothetical protein A2787_01860 [Omnitrophica WOR_2 bacterium RIFCSPHIGHO2_01_FULL_48_9]
MTAEFWINLFEAVSSLVIAVIVAYIAYRQHILDKNKFRLDLYDRRLRGFKVIKRIISETVRSGDFPLKDQDILREFWEAMAESNFIFDKEIVDYFDEIYRKGLDLHFLEERLGTIQGQGEREKIITSRSKCFEWFTHQLKNHTEIFKKYLKIYSS